VKSIADVIPTLSKNEVVLRKNGSTYDVFSPSRLTEEELNMILSGKPPKGLTVFII
jgi:hypothetical protein